MVHNSKTERRDIVWERRGPLPPLPGAERPVVERRAVPPLRPYAVPPLPDEIVPRVYLSNIFTASLYISGAFPGATGQNITHILSIYSGNPDQREQLQLAGRCTLERKEIIIADNERSNLLEHFPEICYFIHTALSNPTSRILVHCYAGVSRSATGIAAYLIWAHRMSWDQALRLLRSKSSVVNPNSGFLAQLQLWQSLDCSILNNNFMLRAEYLSVLVSAGWKDRTGAEPDMLALLGFQRPAKLAQTADQEQSALPNDDTWWWTIWDGM